MTSKLLIPAIRQYMHNDGVGFVTAYDKDETDKIINKLQSSMRDTKNIIVKCFTNTPMGCDGMLTVSVGDYNKLAEHLNKLG